MSDNKNQIEALLKEAAETLEKARVLSEGVDDWFNFDHLGYGAGVTLENGEWMPSSQSC